MPAKVYSNVTKLVIKEKSKSMSNNGEWAWIYRGWIHKDYESTLPVDDDDNPDDSDYAVNTISLDQSESPKHYDVTIAYKLKTSSSAANWSEKKIEKSASIISLAYPVTMTGLTGKLEERRARAESFGQKTFVVGGMKYEYTTYEKHFTWSEENLVKDLNIGVGEAGDPPGITNATPKKWIFTGKQINENGDMVRKDSTWEYSPIEYVDP